VNNVDDDYLEDRDPHFGVSQSMILHLDEITGVQAILEKYNDLNANDEYSDDDISWGK
jgi:hypothetical protein